MGFFAPSGPASEYRVRLGSALLAFLPFTVAGQAVDYSAWAHHKDLYYDASAKGADLAADVRDFPVLIRLDTSNFPFAQARDSGQDLRFAKGDGTPLSFEIDRYDRVAGKAEIWVRIDTIKAGHHGHLARVYWGNPAAGRAGSQAGVFRRGDGFVSVWHLRGQYPTARANSVDSGMEAVPQGYDGDEQSAGLIGYADSLDGAPAGDHLQTWEPFDDLSGGFTFSVWAYPVTAAASAALIDFGNGTAGDNIVLAREGGNGDLVFQAGRDTVASRVTATGAFAPNVWQHIAVTVAGRSVSLYRNGILAASGDLGDSVASVRRGLNYLGRSSRATDAYFAGKLDEPVVSRKARGADWIRLAYANQRADQVLVTTVAPIVCLKRFAVPADTTVPEGGTLILAGAADCAVSYQWSLESGPAQRILDPFVADLQVSMPRVAGDTFTVFRFSADYGDSTASGTVRVAIREAIPEPRFTLPARISWNGRAPLLLGPVVENLVDIRASPQPDIQSVWTLSGIPADTEPGPEGLLLKSSDVNGVLTVRLCMHNNGPATCKETEVTVESPTGLAAPGMRKDAPSGVAAYSVDGRRARDAGGFRFRRLSEQGARKP